MGILQRMRQAAKEETEPHTSAPGAEQAPASVLPIGEREVREAEEIRQKYKQGKVNLENRIIANEQWYKGRHWEQMRGGKKQVSPSSAYLFNAIANKHADALDNFPRPNILPRAEDDKVEAKMLSEIVPVVLDQADFAKVYDAVWWDKLKNGCGVYGIFWDANRNGIGDIVIKPVDLLNLYWAPGITDIQDSPNLFCVELVDNDQLAKMYPQLKDKLGGDTATVAQYHYDDSVDTSEKTEVIDWYYHKDGALHYCKYCNTVVLVATENEPETYPNGWYTHGRYPFAFDVLYPEKGTPAGFGIVDICKDPQEYIDRLDGAILQNALIGARQRWFVRGDQPTINEEEYLDVEKPLVHVNGNLAEDNLRKIDAAGLDSIYVQIQNNKIEELKETAGNRDINTGGGQSGVTAASAIAAMQEAGSKLSRDMIKASYRVYTDIVSTVIELMRQFYDDARAYRIIGEGGEMRFVQYSNAGIVPQPIPSIFGEEMGYRLPMFDIEITAEKSSPYSRMAQNELALQFLNLGFFAPQMVDQSLACLEMMDFDGKDALVQKLQQNGAMQVRLQQAGMILMQMAQQYRPDLLPQIQQILGVQPAPAPAGSGEVELSDSTESPVTERARERTAEMTNPT